MANVREVMVPAELPGFDVLGIVDFKCGHCDAIHASAGLARAPNGALLLMVKHELIPTKMLFEVLLPDLKALRDLLARAEQ